MLRGRGLALSDVPRRPMAGGRFFNVSKNPISCNPGRALRQPASQWEARRPLSDRRICELLRRELEGKDGDCKHGSYPRAHYFLSDSLLKLALLQL